MAVMNVTCCDLCDQLLDSTFLVEHGIIAALFRDLKLVLAQTAPLQ